MTIDELYGKIVADEGLKDAFNKAAAEGKIAEWLAAQGVEATEAELMMFVQGNSDASELTDEQLEAVAGGDDYGEFIDAYSSVL